MGILSNCIRGLVLILSCNGEFGVPLDLQQGNLASSRVKVGNSWFLLRCSRELGVPLELHQGTWRFTQVVAWSS